MKIKNQYIFGGHQQFADKIIAKYPNKGETKEKNNSKRYDEIRELVIKGKIGKAIDILIDLDLDQQLANDCTIIRSQLSILESDMIKGIISYENGMVIRTRITMALLNICNDIF